MSIRPDRPDEIDILANLKQRVRILESIAPEIGGGGTIFCVGCYEVDPAFAGCVDLVAGDCIDVANTTVPQGTFATIEIPDTEINIGPYACNWAAGFRLQARYVGDFGGAQVHLSALLSHDGDAPVIGGPLPAPSDFGPVTIDTGWSALVFDPTGIGLVGDAWTLILGADNTSVLFDGHVGVGSLCFRWVQLGDLANQVPQPQIEGQMLVAIGSPPQWVVLDPPDPGQVLTGNGSGIPEWT